MHSCAAADPWAQNPFGGEGAPAAAETGAPAPAPPSEPSSARSTGNFDF